MSSDHSRSAWDSHLALDVQTSQPLFYLTPANDKARETITLSSNSRFRATRNEEQKIGTPALSVGLLPSHKGAGTLVTLGRKGDIVVEGKGISRIHCSLKINPTTGVVMLHDKSDDATTYVCGHDFRDGKRRKVVVMPEKNDLVHLGRRGRVRFKLIWCYDFEEALTKGKDLVLSQNPFVCTVTRDAKPSRQHVVSKWVKAGTLGHGKFAIVYKVVDLENGEMMAMKSLKGSGHRMDRLRKSARAEMKILRRLNHPNIVKLVSSGSLRRGGAEIFMKMEEGNLDSLLDDTTRLAQSAETEHRLEIGKTVMHHMLRALKHLDKKGIVHCDVKPANILYRTRQNGSYQFVLADFGLSKRVSVFSLDRTEAGSSAFMAPEVFHRCAKSTHKVDVWALYVTMLWIWDVNEFSTNCLKTNTQDGIHDLVREIASSKEYPLIRPFRRMASRNPHNRISAQRMLTKWRDIEWPSFKKRESSSRTLTDSSWRSSTTLIDPALQPSDFPIPEPLLKYQLIEAPLPSDSSTDEKVPEGGYERRVSDFGPVAFGGPLRTLDLGGKPRRLSTDLQAVVFEDLYRVG